MEILTQVSDLFYLGRFHVESHDLALLSQVGTKILTKWIANFGNPLLAPSILCTIYLEPGWELNNY